MQELADWLSAPDPERFPYDAVLAEFHRVGKHFVARDVLEELDRARATAPGTSLARFLDFALDKRDGRYDNPSYLALDLLPLPGTGDGAHDPRHAAWQRDRLLAMLIVDTLRFELAAAERRTTMLPQLRPSARITAKRCRLGLRAIGPALQRLGLGDLPATSDPLAAAHEVGERVAGDLTASEARTLRLTILPVSVVHDEYMFLRMLQAYETTFALMAVSLAAAVVALAEGRATGAAEAITRAEHALREAAPLWSFVATVQPQAFLTFREFTEGASAIQSRSYKTVESLCRRPDEPRLESAAYRSVPEVRRRVLDGQANLEEALAASGLDPTAHDIVTAAMRRFETALVKWRQSHFRLAMKLLGRRPGTGYTEGVPYLEKARATPVFTPAACAA